MSEDLILFHSSFLLFSFKGGKVVIILSGRYAGRKAVVVKASDDGNDSKKFGHAIGMLHFILIILLFYIIFSFGFRFLFQYLCFCYFVLFVQLLALIDTPERLSRICLRTKSTRDPRLSLSLKL
jgi:hypothetical protein